MTPSAPVASVRFYEFEKASRILVKLERLVSRDITRPALQRVTLPSCQ